MLSLLSLDLLKPHQPILIALSGGADSVCLTHFLSTQTNFPIILAHFNHHLRDTESQQDEFFVKKFAKTMQLPLEVGHWQTPQKSETKARTARYTFLRKIQKKHQAQVICLAHHQDDQVETIFFNFIRGTGIKGLQGMPVLENTLFRPLLGISKTEILAYCKKHQLSYCTDQSNFTLDYNRNFLRLEVLPKLKKINPKLTQTITQNAQTFYEINDFLQTSFQPYLNSPSLLLTDFIQLKPAQQSALLKQKLAKFIEPDFKKIQTILTFLKKGKTGKYQVFGTLRIRIEYGKVFFEKNLTSKQSVVTKPLVLNQSHLFGNTQITSKVISNKTSNSDSIFLDYHKINFPLSLRTWQKGDYFQPTGLQGTQKLSDFFINQKIPQTERKTLPLIVDATNQILAISKLRISQIAAPTNQTKKFLQIKIQ